MDEPLTEASARLAYQFLLGRAPESEAMLHYAMSFGTVGRLREAFLNSLEFEPILHRRPRVVAADAPPLQVEWHAPDAALLAMLDGVRLAWDAPPEAADRAGGGQAQAAVLRACLARNGLALRGAAFELGCGGGALAGELARQMHVTACDAAPAALAAAREAGARAQLTLAGDLRFGMQTPFDLFVSFHALQHSPPPLAARVLDRAFALLRPGGVAVFQALTYGYGYSYALATPPPPAGDAASDLHVLPQAAIFQLAAEAGCAVLEVFDDLSVPPAALWRSSMFVLRKAA